MVARWLLSFSMVLLFGCYGFARWLLWCCFVVAMVLLCYVLLGVD